jgi:hypothetical protein
VTTRSSANVCWQFWLEADSLAHKTLIDPTPKLRELVQVVHSFVRLFFHFSSRAAKSPVGLHRSAVSYQPFIF